VLGCGPAKVAQSSLGDGEKGARACPRRSNVEPASDISRGQVSVSGESNSAAGRLQTMLRAWAATARNVLDSSCFGERAYRSTTRDYRHAEGGRCRGAKSGQASPERNLPPMEQATTAATSRHGDPRQAFGRAGELWRTGDGSGASTGRSSSSQGAIRLAVAALFSGYKRWISPLLPRACRFSPTCSEYARLAVLKYGVWRGGWRGLARVAKCQPFNRGGLDLP